MLGIQTYTWNIYLYNCSKSFNSSLQADILLGVPWGITERVH